MLQLVAVETPYAGDVARNTEYARMCMADSLRRGEAPFLSHLLYTQVLDDGTPTERMQGIDAGIAWSERADLAAVYYDLGISNGMRAAIEHYRAIGKRVELRRLWPSDVGAAIRDGRLEFEKAARLI